MPGVFEVQRGEHGVPEHRGAVYDKSAECVGGVRDEGEEGIGLYATITINNRSARPTESLLARPHSESPHVSLGTCRLIIAPSDRRGN